MRVSFLISCFLLSGWALSAAVPDQNPDEKSFDLPAGLAEFTLKSFSSQSGLDVVFETKTVAGIHTGAVQGRFSPIKAVDLMLARTPLVATQHAPGGAIVISPEPGARPADPSADGGHGKTKPGAI